MLYKVLERADALELWARLGEEGKAPTALILASQFIPAYSVGVEPWIERLAKLYLQGLCRKYAHFKVVMAPYGGGKTHFLMALGARALEENFAVSYIPCGPGTSLDNPLDVYRAFAKGIQLPGMNSPGILSFLRQVVAFKKQQILDHKAPDPELAFGLWLKSIREAQHPENAFGRVIAVALSGESPNSFAETVEAAQRWLQGDIDTLTKEERGILRLAKVSGRAKNELGQNLLLSLVRFVQQAGAHGVAILFDEVETLFSARGRALLRILSAMRVLIDLPNDVPGGVPLFGVFSAVPDILQELSKYPALQQRLSVKGCPFHEGNDLAMQLHLEKLDRQEHLLAEIGKRLIDLGSVALGCSFNLPLQHQNAALLANVAAERSLEVDARRLFIKAWVNILDLQNREGEREFSPQEFSERYQGFFDSIKSAEESQDEP